MTPVTRGIRRCPALLAAGLLLGCASTSGSTAADTEDPVATTADRATPTSGCAGNCSLRVENRLDTEVHVSTERQSALPDLGVVRANHTGLFELSDFEGQQLELWVRAAKSRELLHVTCVRQFPRGVGRLILGSEITGGAC